MKAHSDSTMEFTVHLTLMESEARALRALTEYGHANFLKFFYENLGKTYLQPHEKGLITLFMSIEQEIPKHLKRIDSTRKTFNESI